MREQALMAMNQSEEAEFAMLARRTEWRREQEKQARRREAEDKQRADMERKAKRRGLVNFVVTQVLAGAVTFVCLAGALIGWELGAPWYLVVPLAAGGLLAQQMAGRETL